MGAVLTQRPPQWWGQAGQKGPGAVSKGSASEAPLGPSPMTACGCLISKMTERGGTRWGPVAT